MKRKTAVFDRAVLSAGVIVLSFCLMDCGGRSGRTRPENTVSLERPPAGLAASEIPQFVCISSDDNGYSGLPGSGNEGGLHYLTELCAAKRNPAGAGIARNFDGTSPHYSFFVITRYIAPDANGSPTGTYAGGDLPVFVKRAWREAVEHGHEIGIHTHSHPHGRPFTVAQWEAEMRRSIEILTRPWDPAEIPDRPHPVSGIGVPRSALAGFRAPFLESSDNGMAAAYRLGFVYDSSIEEGPELGPHRGDFVWPYTLDQGIPDNDPPIGRHPGLWEMPIINFVVPLDGECPRYGVPAGMRAALKERQSYFDPANGEITGMDWNLWNEFLMSPAEFTATLEYTLDLHLARNRSPMTVGLHSEIYTIKKGRESDSAVILTRRAALEAFFDYALGKPEVRFANHRELLGWMRDPVPLR
ncbi:MAG: polysaccharide deacetylase family protein [Candidatus Aminicenantales bacterium]